MKADTFPLFRQAEPGLTPRGLNRTGQPGGAERAARRAAIAKRFVTKTVGQLFVKAQVDWRFAAFYSEPPAL